MLVFYIKLVYCVYYVTLKCHLSYKKDMNTKTVLKDQRLIPAKSQLQEMIIFGFISLWIVLVAVLYFS